jgi:hypothetical protein
LTPPLSSLSPDLPAEDIEYPAPPSPQALDL